MANECPSFVPGQPQAVVEFRWWNVEESEGMDRLPVVLRGEFLAVGIVPFNLVRMDVVVATTLNIN